MGAFPGLFPPVHSLFGELPMVTPSAAPSPQGATALTRALCLLILVLMAAAGTYGAIIALRYFRQIGV
jgi:hypothetical protein